MMAVLSDESASRTIVPKSQAGLVKNIKLTCKIKPCTNEMSSDGQTLAGVKNRVGKWQLISELHQIEREKKAEMRMHNTAKQRFKAKYHKLEQFVDRSKDAPDVRMYETHNPGFCFRRNGECRTPQTPSPNPSVDYEDIYSLLFTDKEVDIEKVLCLHLLTAHKTETLLPPVKSHKPLTMVGKNQSPVERLIERSRKKRQEDSVTKLLPTYILDITTRKPGEEKAQKANDIVIRDGRLAARVIINDKIVQLVHIVLTALQHTNPEKMNKLLKMTSDVEVIKEVIDKPHIIEFLGSLCGCTLVCSCESFHLTQPFRALIVPLELETEPNHALTKLLQHIRRNVLQLPAPNAVRNVQSRSQLTKEEISPNAPPSPKNIKKPDSVSINSKSSVPQENVDLQPGLSKKASIRSRDSKGATSITSRGIKKDSRRKPDVKNLSNNSSTTSGAYPAFLNFLDEDNRSKGKRVPSKPFKNQKTVKTKQNKSKSLEDSASENASTIANLDASNPITTDIFGRMDIRAVAAMISNKAAAAHKRDMKKLNEDQSYSEAPRRCLIPEHQETKVSIKHMHCPACMQKWKNPLPDPKTSKIRKIPAPSLDQTPYAEFKTGSAVRLSLMIDEEMKKLNESRRDKPPEDNKLPFREYKNRANFLRKLTVDTVDMDALDLAKIAQEIKEKETQKKLLKFLEKKI